MILRIAMAPSSTYNLRGSRNTSKQNTPTKSTSKVNSRSETLQKNKRVSHESPSKEMKQTLEDEFADIPSTIATLLSEMNITSLKQLKMISRDELLEHALALRSKAVESDIINAWIKCLHARAIDPNCKFSSWMDWLENKIKIREASNQAKSTSMDLGEAARIIIKRTELIKQRQGLRHRNWPRLKNVSWSDLKVAKTKLTSLPTGKALKDRIKAEELKKARSLLRARSIPN